MDDREQPPPRRPCPLTEIRDVQRMRLQPGDVLVARMKAGQMPVEALWNVKQTLERAFPGHTVVVLLDGVELVVHTPSAPAPCAS